MSATTPSCNSQQARKSEKDGWKYIALSDSAMFTSVEDAMGSKHFLLIYM